MIKIIKVYLNNSSYNIYLEENLSRKIPLYLSRLNLGNFCAVITNKKVYSLYKKIIKDMFHDIPHMVLILPDKETIKSEKWSSFVLHKLLEKNSLKKKLFICCIGGGVVGDLGGFVSSIYKRGTPYIQIPTTLLAQIDASIGGKTAIDFGGIKNIVGTFYQPQAVFIDPLFLRTLSMREIKQGVSEAIKYGIVEDKDMFYSMQKNYSRILDLDIDYIKKIIYKCAKIKANIVSRDEKEIKGIRTLLNFGHTIAHALESTLNFKRISHGDAVALGMIQAAYLSKYMKLCSSHDVKTIEDIIALYDLPRKLLFDKNTLIQRIMHDKKFTRGKIRMVLIHKIGEAVVKEEVPLKIINKSLQHIEA